MFLLIPPEDTAFTMIMAIYIPLCFYLYVLFLLFLLAGGAIYIPLCFYLYRKMKVRDLYEKNLHSTMFLLIRGRTIEIFGAESAFTFHYVSTYTGPGRGSACNCLDLHSTMFLLILALLSLIPRTDYIYIPLCFYLYHYR